MVHTFGLLNRLFALDTESGSFFEIDPIVKAIIDGDDMSPFSSCEIAEAKTEIERLKSDGVLFAPQVKAELPPFNPVIKAMCLNVSHNCNLACEYCFADGGTYNDERKTMSYDTAKAAIDMLVEMSGTRRTLAAANLCSTSRLLKKRCSMRVLSKRSAAKIFALP